MTDPFAAERDQCLSMFGAAYALGGMVFPPGALVLEVGCAEADWMTPMLAARPDLRIVGIDWREAVRPGRVIRGDVLVENWPAQTFDVMVGISSIEHIGLGHYDSDPVDLDGDRHCMARVHRWLKPGGWVYLDVPYDRDGYRVHGTSHRSYDDAAIASRLVAGFTPQATWYFRHSAVHTPLSTPPAADGQMVYAAVYATKG